MAIPSPLFRLAGAAIALALAVTNAASFADDKPAKKEPEKKAPEKKDQKKVPFGDLDEALRKLLEEQGGQFPDNEEFKKSMEEMRKIMDENRRVLESLNKGGVPGSNFGRGQGNRLGARLEKPSIVLVKQLKLPEREGLAVETVQPGSAAEKGGLKVGDILLEANGKKVPNDAREFLKSLGEIKAGTAIDLVVLREGKRETVKGFTVPEASRESKPLNKEELRKQLQQQSKEAREELDKIRKQTNPGAKEPEAKKDGETKKP